MSSEDGSWSTVSSYHCDSFSTDSGEQARKKQDRAEILPKVWECGVCSECFSATLLERQPYMFSACGHSVCKACSENLQSCACPFDGVSSHTRPIKNNGLLELLPALAEIIAPTAEKCRNPQHTDSPVEATGYCKLCRMCYCGACLDIHARICSASEVVAMSERPSSPDLCAEDQLPLTLVCLQCEGQPLICKLCVFDHGNHKGHTVERIVDAGARLRANIADCKAKLAAHAQLAEAAVEETNMQIEHLASKLRDGETVINTEFDRVVSALQLRREESLAEFRTLSAVQRSELINYLSATGQVSSQVQASLALIEKIPTSNGPEFVHAAGSILAACSKVLTFGFSTPAPEEIRTSFKVPDLNSFGSIHRQAYMQQYSVGHIVPASDGRRFAEHSFVHGPSNGHVAISLVPQLCLNEVSWIKISVSSTANHWVFIGVSSSLTPSQNSYGEENTWGFACNKQVYRAGMMSVEESLSQASSTFVLKFDPLTYSITAKDEGTTWSKTLTMPTLPGQMYFHVNSYDADQQIFIKPVENSERF